MAINNDNNDRRGRVLDRRGVDRRLWQERRVDRRNLTKRKCRLSLKNWIRFLTKPRLGVDRRKADQRVFEERRGTNPVSLLTKEELSALLED